MLLGINHITLTVQNLEEDFSFYRDILGLTPLCKIKNKSAYFLCGKDWLVLVEDRQKSNSQKNDSYAHLAFSVGNDEFVLMSEKIKKAKVVIWQNNKSEGDSLYFLDPSGNKLEIHLGDWESRITSLKENFKNEIEFFI